MKIALLVLLPVFVGCSNYRNSVPPPLPQKSSPASQENSAELKTLKGKVPSRDFAMPLIAHEILPGSTQGCFIDADTEECVVVLYPEGMIIPDREVPIQVRGRMQVVASTPPSSDEHKIYMRYRQKVMVVDSWKNAE